MAPQSIFLDRDGVINRIVFRDAKPTSPRSFDEFRFEGKVSESIRRLRAGGFKFFVVSNQPDLARGLLSSEALRAMTDEIMARLAVDAVRVCPHDDRDDCECRKPRPGMLLELAREHDIALGESFMIGDSWKDMQAGSAVGCTTIILDRSYNQGTPADRRVADLNEAVDFILQGDRA